MKLIRICLLLAGFCGCVKNNESGSIDVISFSPAEGTKIDCNTIIQYRVRYEINELVSEGSHTVTATNNQTSDKTYSVKNSSGEVSDQISGNQFYSDLFGVKCRRGKVPFSFQFSLRLANGTKIDSKTFLFDEVPGTSCLANTGYC